MTKLAKTVQIQAPKPDQTKGRVYIDGEPLPWYLDDQPVQTEVRTDGHIVVILRVLVSDGVVTTGGWPQPDDDTAGTTGTDEAHRTYA